MRPGCTAIDVGANRGYYSFALSRIAGRVEAFEPNPAVAAFARAKLGKKVRVHELALSDSEGPATLHVPYSVQRTLEHLLGSLHDRYADAASLPVRTAMLDSFGFTDVGFIKIDTEGVELDVIWGARQTIEKNLPNLVVELLNRPPQMVLAAIDQIEAEFGYASWIVHDRRRHPARAALAQLGHSIKTENVLFIPK